MNRARFAVLALLAVMATAACSKSKQEAAMALDEARLSIGEARRSGADPRGSRMFEAQTSLTTAESSFEEGHFGNAKTYADRAIVAARAAKSDVRAQKPVAAKPSRQKRRK